MLARIMNKSFGTIRDMFTMADAPIFGIENIENEIRMLSRNSKSHEWTSPSGELFQIEIPPTVYPPREDTDLMAKAIIKLGPGKGRKCLEIGCGSGVLSVLASRQGWKVTACDINPFAVACTKGIAKDNFSDIVVNEGGPSPKIDGEVNQWTGGDKFDLVFWNLPYLKPDSSMTDTLGPLEEAALLDTDREGLFERVLNLMKTDILNDSGIALFVVSSQNLNLQPKLKCISKGFSARTISKLSFDDGEELQVIAVWKPFINGKKIFLEQASSTNTQLLDSSYPVGSSICTPKQISGHGRRGRDWIDTEKSFAGSWKLYDSATLLEPGLLQIVAGTCVKNSILSLTKDIKGKEILIKWPNDLLVFESSKWKKFCGILVESRTSGKNMSVVLGIGINLSGTESIGREFDIGFLQSFTKMIKFEDIQNTIDASIASFFEQKDMIPNISLEDLLQLVNTEVETSISHLSQPLYRNNHVTFKSILNDGKMEIISGNGDVIAIDDGESLTWGKIS